jgi:hypothetical protein
MLALLSRLLFGQRQTGLRGVFDRRRRGGLAGGVGKHPGASAFGTIATIAAPFVIRKLMARRAATASPARTAR